MEQLPKKLIELLQNLQIQVNTATLLAPRACDSISSNEVSNSVLLQLNKNLEKQNMSSNFAMFDSLTKFVGNGDDNFEEFMAEFISIADSIHLKSEQAAAQLFLKLGRDARFFALNLTKSIRTDFNLLRDNLKSEFNKKSYLSHKNKIKK
jgi:hypothetical protein